MVAAGVMLLAPACGRKDAASPPTAAAPPVAKAPAAPPPAPAAPAWEGFQPEAGPVITAHPVKISDMTPSEQKYGLAPTRGQGIDFQDNIVLIEHGDTAIRSWASNGLGWTLDASNPQVAALKEGDVLFATSRCIGRVLKLTREGQDVSVLLGPVQIQDVIKRGNVAYHAPLDLDSLTAIEVADDPAAFGSPYADQMKAQTTGSIGRGPTAAVIRDVQYFVVSPRGEWRPMRTIRRSATSQLARLTDGEPHGPSLVRASYAPQLPPLNDVLSATPCWKDCGGLGLRMTVKKGGLTVAISVIFHLQAPTVDFDISIGNGLWSEVQLTGAVGFEVSVEGLTDETFQRNVNDIGVLPVDLVLPLSGGGVGFDVHFHHDVQLSTAFSAKTSILKAHSSLTMHGSLGLDYHQGHFDARALFGSDLTGLASNIEGISVGINSIVVGVNQRVLVGFGVAGFAVGPFVTLTSTETALKQADSAASLMLTQQRIADCRQGTFLMTLTGGVGYGLPKVVVKVVNFFLGLFHAPSIAESGVLVSLPKQAPIVDKKESIPDRCAG
ncbi:MAG TPA: hypothetical protein VHB78_04965 [Vicinamibacterales bacterium]|nr:hypothetical protein [Vicinamibacterales bacterium]